MSNCLVVSYVMHYCESVQAGTQLGLSIYIVTRLYNLWAVLIKLLKQIATPYLTQHFFPEHLTSR